MTDPLPCAVCRARPVTNTAMMLCGRCTGSLERLVASLRLGPDEEPPAYDVAWWAARRAMRHERARHVRREPVLRCDPMFFERGEVATFELGLTRNAVQRTDGRPSRFFTVFGVELFVTARHGFELAFSVDALNPEQQSPEAARAFIAGCVELPHERAFGMLLLVGSSHDILRIEAVATSWKLPAFANTVPNTRAVFKFCSDKPVTNLSMLLRRNGLPG